jgi:DNA invertase Pin-like site-specific DNA recombinase
MLHLYVRVSTDKQDLGVAAQNKQLDDWMQHSATGGRFQWHTDDGVSGSIALDERPAGSKMTAMLRPDDTVVVVKIDRLFRSMCDAVVTIDNWCKNKIHLISLREHIDMSSPYGKAMFHIFSAIAELERGMIRERTKSALEAKKAQTGVCGGIAPYGTKWQGGILVTDEKEMAILEQIIAMNLLPHYRIAEKLNERGWSSRSGKPWTANMVQKILMKNLTRRKICARLFPSPKGESHADNDLSYVAGR